MTVTSARHYSCLANAVLCGAAKFLRQLYITLRIEILSIPKPLQNSCLELVLTIAPIVPTWYYNNFFTDIIIWITDQDYLHCSSILLPYFSFSRHFVLFFIYQPYGNLINDARQNTPTATLVGPTLGHQLSTSCHQHYNVCYLAICIKEPHKVLNRTSNRSKKLYLN